jgi:hypothetical protein
MQVFCNLLFSNSYSKYVTTPAELAGNKYFEKEGLYATIKGPKY